MERRRALSYCPSVRPHTHLLGVEVGHLVVASLCEQDGEHGVRAAARLVHVRSCYGSATRERWCVTRSYLNAEIYSDYIWITSDLSNVISTKKETLILKVLLYSPSFVINIHFWVHKGWGLF